MLCDVQYAKQLQVSNVCWNRGRLLFMIQKLILFLISLLPYTPPASPPLDGYWMDLCTSIYISEVDSSHLLGIHPFLVESSDSGVNVSYPIAQVY